MSDASAEPVEDTIEVSPACGAIIARALPGVSDAVLVASVAKLSRLAAALTPSIARLQSRLEGASPERSPLRSGDLPSLARRLDHEQHWWV